MARHRKKADIQLVGGSSGIDAVKNTLAQSQVPVIFPERLLPGARPEPAQSSWKVTFELFLLCLPRLDD
jgi:aspartokinase-like uncharacterized kinase